MTYDIRDYGAISDGRTINTVAINNAIQACARNDGGTVVVPSGGVYMTGTIWMKSHVELHLEHGAVLKASGDMKDYCTADDYDQNYDVPSEEWVGAHLIVALEVEDIAITGTGTIDGNVAAFVTEKDNIEASTRHFGWFHGFYRAPRPGQTVAVVESKNIQVRDVTFRDLPSWCLFLYGCDYVQVRGISVFNHPAIANTDGMDIDACRYVTVSDCLIDTGDDAFAIRNAHHRLKDKTRVCEYITITSCVLAACACVFRIGVGKGELRHMRISNITAHRGGRLINFCTEYGSTSRTPMYDINFSNIAATGIARPLTIETETGVEVQNVTLENIRTDAHASFRIASAVPGALKDITIKNFDLFLKDDRELTEEELRLRGDYAVDVRNVEGLTLNRVRVFASEKENAKWSGKINVENCPDMIQKDCKF